MEARVTGYMLVPAEAHDWISCYAVAAVWKMTPEEFDELHAHEWLRRMAVHKAAHWSQPTVQQMKINKANKKRNL